MDFFLNAASILACSIAVGGAVWLGAGLLLWSPEERPLRAPALDSMVVRGTFRWCPPALVEYLSAGILTSRSAVAFGSYPWGNVYCFRLVSDADAAPSLAVLIDRHRPFRASVSQFAIGDRQILLRPRRFGAGERASGEIPPVCREILRRLLDDFTERWGRSVSIEASGRLLLLRVTHLPGDERRAVLYREALYLALLINRRLEGRRISGFPGAPVREQVAAAACR